MSQSAISRSYQRYIKERERKLLAKEIEESKQTDSFGKQAIKSIPKAGAATFTLIDARNKIEQANLLNSGLAEATTDIGGKTVQIFNPSGVDTGNFITDTIERSVRPWTERLTPTDEALQAHQEGTIDLEKILREKGANETEISKLINVDKPTTEFTQTVSDVGKGMNPDNFFTKASEANVANETAFKIGKGMQWANVGVGVGRVVAEEDTEEKIHGGIQALTPVLTKMGPTGWTIMGINAILDMLD